MAIKAKNWDYHPTPKEIIKNVKRLMGKGNFKCLFGNKMEIDKLQISVGMVEHDFGTGDGIFVHTNKDGIYVGEKKSPEAIFISFNQTIYLEEGAGNGLNMKLIHFWTTYIKNENNLRLLHYMVLDYIKKCFAENKASYDENKYIYYKKLPSCIKNDEIGEGQ